MFRNKTPQIAVNLDYTILEQLYGLKHVRNKNNLEQLRLKLCKNLRATTLGNNLLVLTKKKCVIESFKTPNLLDVYMQQRDKLGTPEF